MDCFFYYIKTLNIANIMIKIDKKYKRMKYKI